jgi:hypothetical protein
MEGNVMSAKEMLGEKINVMTEEEAQKWLRIIVDTTNIKPSRFPDTLKEYLIQKGWDGKQVISETVDWGGFVGEEVEW